ncbi:hypothetical protein [Endozoicomonas sp. GU-1]|uniref:hypothetical protein n=1 Tax=Endozoicomonas sp. GU-1 TaxID=3009078 RepID=UPI0022B2E587|nr:hypothetical protein [Endozoicomonas sp. GU-1]WBA83352.1 hypothetical protein O2T12_09630 [Endozoicomonas sp. GU-1]WBA86283.1 hypothetical protein O3276_24295 [Endozoicomonas sp. GU-1]
MKQEKELFINDVQALHKRDKGHFKDEVSPSEAGPNVLYNPRTFLDVVKCPDNYRIVLDNDNASPNLGTSEPTTEPPLHHRRKRRDIDQPIPHLTSSATRQTGMLDNIKEGLGRLLGYIGPMSSAPVATSSTQTRITEQATFHNGNSRSNQAPGVANNPQYNANASLTLATLLAAKLNGRKLPSGKDTEPTSERQELLSQAPGMQLLSDSLAIAPQLHSEVAAFIHHLNSNSDPVASQWNRDDLVNMAILLATPTTPAKIPARVTENFLQQALTSSAIGIRHEHPDNIFSAEGMVRGTGTNKGQSQSVFHNQATGETTARGPAMGLAQAMLQAMASNRLAGYSADNQLPDSLSRQIIQQAVQLQQRQNQNSAIQPWKLTDHKNDVTDIKGMIEQRLIPESARQPEKALHNPLINALARGQYEPGRQLFMQHSLQHQLAMVHELAGLPDYLGVDYFAEQLAQLESDLQKATSSKTAANDEITDLQSFALSQRAWQLFNNLYDAKVAVPKEAMNRVKIQAMINRRGLIEPGETRQLQELVLALLPRQASASDHAKLTIKADQAIPSPAKLHKYQHERIASIISSYSALKAFVAKQFPRVFDHAPIDPELKNELINQIARVSLYALKGKITDESWKAVVMEMLKQEYKEFIE